MTSSTASVTVILVTWNSRRHLPHALAGLENGLAGVGSWRLVVADNASTDDTVAYLSRARPEAQVVQTGRNAGYAAGLNAAVAATEPSDFYLFLNPDVRLHAGCVAALVEGIDGDVGITVPRLVDPQGRLQPSLRRSPTVGRALGEAVLGGRLAGRLSGMGELVVEPDAYTRRTVADWASGAAMLVAARCLHDVGPWDESFFLYSEETDFALRAKDRGFLVTLCPGAAATHVGGESHVSPELYSLLIGNRLRLYRRRHGRLQSTAFWAALVLNEMLRSTDRVHRAALAHLARPAQPDARSASQRVPSLTSST